MNDSWRQLLYPLGIIPAIAFTARFILQWLCSEKEKKSIVTPLFWKISLFGNLALLLHALIQIQLHVCLVQGCNAVISWRNLNLMQPFENRWTKASTFSLLIATIAIIPLLFAAQSHLFGFSSYEWFRSPKPFWEIPSLGQNSTLWHTIGLFGLLLFNSRFWIQWWGAERSGKSELSPAFWWMSLSGSVLCIVYFMRIGDIINLIGPISGIIPYVRNLMIIANTKALSVRKN